MPFAPPIVATLSHPGRVRRTNQDVVAADPAHGIYLVADGMGGAAAGEVASRLAADTLLAKLKTAGGRSAEDRLRSAFEAANSAVFQASRAGDRHGMGTTLVALLHRGTTLTLAHVGDSRCYRLRAGELTLLTQDHSLVEEQVRLGTLTAAQAASHPMRNVITRAVGTQATIETDLRTLHPRPGDLYLLASDGLTRELTEPRLLTLLTGPGTPHQLCDSLVERANQAGGHDNITVLLLAFPQEPA